MKCPLITQEVTEGTKHLTQLPADCLQSFCAWWLANDQMCAVRALPCQVAGIVSALAAMNAHMPKQHQFVGRP